MPNTMKAVVVPKPGGPFTITERPVPEPAPGTVRLKVEACGVCHSDQFVKEGYWPKLAYPRVTGHEVAGTVDSVGPGVEGWAKGDRAGIGWHGDHCGVCEPCRRGDFITCENLRVTGLDFDGGYEEYMIAPARGLARIPQGLDFADAAPLMCAGVTTYNSLRHSGAMPGDLVAVSGIGGLGHLALQFARQFGYRVAAVSIGRDKEELATRLGARHFIDAQATDAAAELQRLGGARVIVATAPNAAVISALAKGLGRNGVLLAIAGTNEPVAVPPSLLIAGRRSVQGWPSGTSRDSEDALNFCVLTGVRAMIEKFPLAEAADAYDRMLRNQVRFRSVIVMR
jgi:D-arabinose 1-dehydrogenase-like Zn-dependent alcohol dehydrogenase